MTTPLPCIGISVFRSSIHRKRISAADLSWTTISWNTAFFRRVPSHTQCTAPQGERAYSSRALFLSGHAFSSFARIYCTMFCFSRAMEACGAAIPSPAPRMPCQMSLQLLSSSSEAPADDRCNLSLSPRSYLLRPFPLLSCRKRHMPRQDGVISHA